MTAEEPLGGTSAGVVRVGDTVRRPAGPWAASVHGLLGYLASSRFPAPRALGFDEQGRQVLSWVPGESSWARHAHHWSTLDSMRRAGAFVRWLHDVLDGFEPEPDAVWKGGWGRGDRGTEPICHNDLAPWNVVVDDRGAFGVIDWDGAGPGDRRAELAYAVCGFVPLKRDEACRQVGWATPPLRAKRLEAFVDGYGLEPEERAALGAALVAFAEGGVAFGERMHAVGREPFASWWAADQGAGDRADLAVTRAVVGEWLASRPA